MPSRDRSRSRQPGGSSSAASSVQPEALALCVRCSVALPREGDRNSLAVEGNLIETCRLCYLLGVATQLVPVAALSVEERRVLVVEIESIVVVLEEWTTDAIAAAAHWSSAPTSRSSHAA